jgi:hypothetical protein
MGHLLGQHAQRLLKKPYQTESNIIIYSGPGCPIPSQNHGTGVRGHASRIDKLDLQERCRIGFRRSEVLAPSRRRFEERENRSRQILLKTSNGRMDVLPTGLLHASRYMGIIIGKHAKTLIFTALLDILRYHSAQSELCLNSGGG